MCLCVETEDAAKCWATSSAQDMQLEAVNVAFLSRNERPLETEHTLSQPPNLQGQGEGGLAAVATP